MFPYRVFKGFTLLCGTLNYVENRNITFHLPAELVRQAKIYAAEHDTSVNSLVKELLQEKLSREGRSLTAAARLLALAEEGPYFCADLGSIKREDLYERS